MEWIVPSLVLVGVAALWVTVTGINARLMRVEGRLNRLMRHFELESEPPLSDRVKELANVPSRKIEAIKAHRAETGAGLAEAKDAVEAYIHSR